MRYFVFIFLISICILFTEAYIRSNLNSTNNNKKFIYKKKVIPEKYFVAPNYKLATCSVHKSFSAMITSILCYLDDEKEFFRKYNHLADFTFKFKSCVHKKNNSITSFDQLIRKHGNGNKRKFLNNWKVLMIVRNPIERFISGFVHICYKRERRGIGHTKEFCLGCYSNFKCFVNKMYNIIKSGYNSMITSYRPMRTHFFPQTMQCNYRINKNKFTILKYDPKNLDAFYKSLKNIFIEQNVPRAKVEYIDKEIRSRRINHSTTGKEKTIEFIERFYKQKKIIEKLIEIYYSDFEEFGFKIPSI
ncbi:Sulfotransferase family-containing protein [Strongyloides ratti]|uniref:Sulfotransferase family-containing protein n=1 Tax=Strongyloides ratti TaxID=34506 RepID=A0A090N033_STRRB|nr:Sulfotransferase family-containing protein [Strongyloides ratti]CEF69985.1 Sulfotransferase family-containing protein [Strongyloides ratti]